VSTTPRTVSAAPPRPPHQVVGKRPAT